MKLQFKSVKEDTPGEKLGAEFDRLWPEYRRWYLSRGESARPTYFECESALREHMPELVPAWEAVSEAVGGDDLQARFLSQYQPPPYLMGCSQAAWTRGGTRLVRNYDYHPQLCEGLFLLTQWGRRRVMAASDCLVGVLDGMNDSGLCVSLAFGGRRVVGDGFSAPMLLRYVLETCATVAEAESVVRRIPLHMAYNLLLADRGGNVATARITPGGPARLTGAAASTNHQERVMLPRHARTTATKARETRLLRLLDDPELDAGDFLHAFLEPPLHNTSYAQGFGTLYTAAYDPGRGEAVLAWPGHQRRFSFDDFPEREWTVEVSARPRADETQ